MRQPGYHDTTKHTQPRGRHYVIQGKLCDVNKPSRSRVLPIPRHPPSSNVTSTVQAHTSCQRSATPRDAPLQNTSKQHPLPPHATKAQAAMHALLLLPCKPSLRQLVRLSHEPVLLDRCACIISPLGAPGASGQGALSKHISCQRSAMPRDAPWKCTLLTLKQHPLPPHDTKAQAAMQHWQCMLC